MATKADIDERTVTVYDKKGRTVLPKKVRKELNIQPGDEVTYIIVNGNVTLTKKDE